MPLIGRNGPNASFRQAQRLQFDLICSKLVTHYQNDVRFLMTSKCLPHWVCLKAEMKRILPRLTTRDKCVEAFYSHQYFISKELSALPRHWYTYIKSWTYSSRWIICPRPEDDIRLKSWKGLYKIKDENHSSQINKKLSEYQGLSLST